jgi:hypothetical protein
MLPRIRRWSPGTPGSLLVHKPSFRGLKYYNY